VKSSSAYKEYNWGVIIDACVIILLFTAFYFIDIGVAVFIGIITAVILLTRRIILAHNPGFIKGHHIYYDGKELMVPKGVDVFDLSTVSSMDFLHKYIEIVRGILIPPSIFIIRFSGIIELMEAELDILSESIRRLQNSEIIVILSDANINVQNQFRQNGIERKVGEGNIFDNIKSALIRATILKSEGSLSKNIGSKNIVIVRVKDL